MIVLRKSMLIYLLCFMVLISGIASADTIYLRNGGKITGKVIKDNGSTVTIDIGGGTVVQNKTDILRVKTEVTLQPKESKALKATGEESATPMLETKKKGIFGMVGGVVDTAFSILKFDFLKKNK